MKFSFCLIEHGAADQIRQVKTFYVMSYYFVARNILQSGGCDGGEICFGWP